MQTTAALETITQETLSLPPLAKGAYLEVIEGPARRLADTPRALKIEPALSNALLSDIETDGAKDALPLLAFTLERLYVEHGGDGTLSLADYNALGRVKGSIEAAVERALKAFDANLAVPRDRNAKLALLRRELIPWLAGIDLDTGCPRRRVARLSEIPTEARPIIDHLVDARLLSTDTDRVTREITIEPAHEALLRQWGLLKGWLEEDLAALTALEGVKRAAVDWDANGKQLAWLSHRSGRLEEAEKQTVREAFKDFLSSNERAYLAACRSLENEDTRRKQRMRSIVTYGSLASAIGLLALSIFAGFKWLEAQRQTQAAVTAQNIAERNQSASLASLAETRLANDPLSAIKLALASWPRDQSSTIGRTRYTLDLLRRAVPVQYLRRNLVGHTGTVHDADLSPDQLTLLTASNDGTARIWNLTTGITERVLSPNSGALYRARFSIDGARIITAGKSTSAQVWDRNSGQLVLSLDGHEGAVENPQFSRDGTRILTTSGKTAYLWDARTGQRLATLSGHPTEIRKAAFSPDGSRIVTADGAWDGYRPAMIGIWDGKSEVQISLYEGHRAIIHGLAFAPDGKTFATCSGTSDNWINNDLAAKVWDTATGKLTLELKGHTAMIYGIAFSPDGKTIATGSYDNTARLWNAADGKELHVLKGHKSMVGSVSFSSGGSRLITTSTSEDGTVRLWDVASGTEVAVMNGRAGSVERALITYHGDTVVTVSQDSVVRVWGTRPIVSRRRLNYADAITSLSQSPDGTRLLMSSDDGSVAVWDAAGENRILRIPPIKYKVWSAQFTPKGDRILTVTADEIARLWSIDGGQPKEIRTVSEHNYHAPPAFSPDGRRIAATSPEYGIAVQDAETGAVQVKFADGLSLATDFVYSPDGKHIATTHKDGSARVWNADTGALIATFTGHRALALAVKFSPDGTKLLTSSTDSTARLWNIPTAQLSHVLRGHYGVVTDIDFSPDGSLVLTASKDKTARLWSVETGHQVAVLSGHAAPLTKARFSPTGRFIATVSGDTTARLWDTATASTIAIFRGHGKAITHVMFAHDESQLITGAKDYEVRFWDLRGIPEGNLFQVICGQLPDHELDAVAGSLGLSSVPPICTGTEPLPEGSMLVDPIELPTNRSDHGLQKAWLLLFESRYGEANSYAEPWAISRRPNKGRELQALALMLDGKTAEARKLFDAGRGTLVQSDVLNVDFRVWEDEVLDDIKELREAGLSRPLMDEIDRECKNRMAAQRQFIAMRDAAVKSFNDKDFKGALTGFQEVSTYIQSLSMNEPWNQNYRLLHAQAEADIAATQLSLNRLADAEASYRDAIAISEKAAKEFDEPVFYRDVNRKLLALADFAKDKRPLLEHALEMQRELLLAQADGFEETTQTGPRLLQALIELEITDRKAAEEAKDWTRAVAIEKRILARNEYGADHGIAGASDGVKGALGSLSWYHLLAHEFDQALSAAQHAIDLDDNPEDPLHFDIVATSNKAHALMFLGRLDEAARVYASGRGHFEKDDDGNNKRPWEEVILADFAALRGARLDHPFMKTIEADF